jgi:hypothetical protein
MERSVPLWLAILGATALLTLAAAPAAVPQDVTYGFNLLGPQTATNGTQTIAVTGAGSFDPAADTIVASGTFQITNNSNGAVVSAGTWKATAFNSFCSRGGPSSGFQGGVLVITVTLFPIGREPVTGVTLTVNCLIFAPPNNANTCSPVGEGVTVTGAVGGFTTIVRGATLFHLNE